MQDEDKTKQQLLDEVAALRQRIATLEGVDSQPERDEEAWCRPQTAFGEGDQLSHSGAWETTLQRLYAILSNMYSSVLLVTNDGQVEFANQAFCDQYGLDDSPADLVGLEAHDMLEKIKNAYLHPDEAVARIREIVDRGQLVRGEELALQGGRTCLRDFVPLDVHGKPYGRLWLHFDITERKQAEAALRESEEKYRILVEMSPDGVLTTDVRGYVTFVSRQVLQYYGTSDAAEIIGHDPLAFIAQEDHQRFIDNLQRTLEEGINRDIEYSFLKKDGTPLPCEVAAAVIRDSAGKPNGQVAILRDITERKKAQAALALAHAELEQAKQAAETAYQTLFQSANDAIFMLQNNLYSDCNPMATHVFGFPREEMIGRSPAVLSPPRQPDGRDSEEVALEFIRAAQEGKPQFFAWTHQRADGTLAMTEVSLSRLEAYSPATLLAIVRDVSERKKAEETLQQMHLQLTHVARLSTLGEMVAELAHELNHPIYAILNYAKASRNVLAEEGPPDLDSLREWNEEIADIALSAGTVIKRLRSFARRAESPRAACPIEEIVKEALGLVNLEMRGARVTAETFFSVRSPPIQVDRVQIQQVLVNLLSNAVEAMETSPVDKRRITIRTSLRDALVEVSVADRGGGLPPEGATKIFEPFTSTKPDGLGMGLSIARTIVEAHGGQLWAGSNPEGGAVFHFTLPFDAGGHCDDV